MKPALYLFVGYPGAGKTTIAQLIEQRTGAVHLWADNIRQQMFDKPTHDRAESKQLYDTLNAEAETMVGRGQSVIFDTNFNFYDDRELMRQIALKHDSTPVLIWVTTPIEVARQRAVQQSENMPTRLFGNMPLSDFERMAGNLQPPRAEECAVLLDGSHLDPEAVYQALQI
jgi:predicted kinase